MKYLGIHRAALAVGLAAVLLTGACSDEQGSTEAAGPDLSPAESPLAIYLGSVWGGDEDEFVTKLIAVEDRIAQCMAEQGFEYTALDKESLTARSTSVGRSFEDRNTQEWVATNGYGLPTGEEGAGTDPNAAYIETLSQASKAQYETALYGGWDLPEGLTVEEQMDWIPPWEDRGCNGAAQHEVLAQFPEADPQFTDLMQAREELWARTYEDPAVAAADARWADCMADAGYPGFTTPDDAASSIADARSSAWNDAQSTLQNDVPYDEENPSYAEVTIDPAAQADLRELELATAMADFTCRQDTGYDDAVLKVQFELEEQFIEDHKSELDALIAEYGT